MAKPSLTERDWVEIYAALWTKVQAIERGDYEPSDEEVNTAEWAAHLWEIIKKIGPDGKNMGGK